MHFFSYIFSNIKQHYISFKSPKFYLPSTFSPFILSKLSEFDRTDQSFPKLLNCNEFTLCESSKLSTRLNVYNKPPVSFSIEFSIYNERRARSEYRFKLLFHKNCGNERLWSDRYCGLLTRDIIDGEEVTTKLDRTKYEDVLLNLDLNSVQQFDTRTLTALKYYIGTSMSIFTFIEILRNLKEDNIREFYPAEPTLTVENIRKTVDNLMTGKMEDVIKNLISLSSLIR